MGKYVIQINEDNLDMLAVLNGGLKPKVEDDKTYLIIDTAEDAPNDIKHEDDLYEDGSSVLSSDYHWLIG